MKAEHQFTLSHCHYFSQELQRKDISERRAEYYFVLIFGQMGWKAPSPEDRCATAPFHPQPRSSSFHHQTVDAVFWPLPLSDLPSFLRHWVFYPSHALHPFPFVSQRLPITSKDGSPRTVSPFFITFDPLAAFNSGVLPIFETYPILSLPVP